MSGWLRAHVAQQTQGEEPRVPDEMSGSDVGEEDVCSSGNWSWRRFEVNTGHVGHWDVDLTSFSFHPASFMSSVVLPSFFSHHVLLFVVSVSHCVPIPEKLNR